MGSDNPVGVVLFDGVCNLCHGSVRFLVRRDRRARLRFAPVESDAGRALLERHGLADERPDSMVYLEGNRAYVRSDAALRVARRLDGPWPILFGLIVVPRPIRDWGYRLVARNRYRWFGRLEACPMPTPELRERFLAEDAAPA